MLPNFLVVLTVHILPYMFTVHVSHVLPYTFDRFQVGATSIGARNCATVHILPYTFHTFLGIFR